MHAYSGDGYFNWAAWYRRTRIALIAPIALGTVCVSLAVEAQISPPAGPLAQADQRSAAQAGTPDVHRTSPLPGTPATAPVDAGALISSGAPATVDGIRARLTIDQRQDVKIQEILTQLQSNLAGNATQITELESQLADLNKRLDQAQTENGALQRQLDDSRAKHLEGDDRVDALTGQLLELRQELGASDAENASLQQQLQAVHSELTGRSSELVDLRERLTGTDSAIESATAEKSELQNRLAEAKMQISELQQSRASLSASFKELRAESETRASALAEVESAAKTTREELTQTQTALNDMGIQADQFKQQASAMQTRLLGVESAIDSTQAKLISLQNQRAILGILLALAVIGLVFNWKRGDSSSG